MEDFKTICKYKNFAIFPYFFQKTDVSLKNPTFSNIIPHVKHILNTFKLRTQNTRLYLFRYIDFIYSCYLDKHPSLCEQFS